MEITRVGVIGSGIMGAGIAQVAAQAGYEVVLRSRQQATAEPGDPEGHQEGRLTGATGSGARTATDQAEASPSLAGRSMTSAAGEPARMPTPVSPVSLRPASHSARSCSSSAEE